MAQQTLDDILAATQEETTIEQSCITLMNGLTQQLAAAVAANDPAKIQAIMNQIQQNKAAMAAAIAANTPAASTPAPAAP